MQRITITLDDDLMEELDAAIVERGYQNRLEAIRDFTRAGMQQAAQENGKSAARCSTSPITSLPSAASNTAAW